MAVPSYVTVAELKLRVTIPSTVQDATLTAILTAIGAQINAYLGFDPTVTAITEYLDANGSRFVGLTRWPVANAAAVTSVYFDWNGNYGQTTGAFDSTTLLTQGTDYSVSFPPGSKFAQLYRIDYCWDWQWTREVNRLSSFQGSILGCIKAVYTVTNTDLLLACTEAAYSEASYRVRQMPFGVGVVMSDGMDGANVSIQAIPAKPGAVRNSADKFVSPYAAGFLDPWMRTRIT